MIRLALDLRAVFGWSLVKAARIAVLATLPGKFDVPLKIREDSRQDVSKTLHDTAEDGGMVA